MLKSKNLYLRLLSEDDLNDRVNWINDRDNIKTLLFDWPTSIEKTKKWFSNSLMDKSKINFSIVDLNKDVLIGMTGFIQIDYVNRNAQFYITIGNKNFRGLGLSKEVISMVLEYGFLELALEKIYLYTLPNNQKARRIYELNGFKNDGVLRNHLVRRGVLQDIYVHSILKEEWIKINGN